MLILVRGYELALCFVGTIILVANLEVRMQLFPDSHVVPAHGPEMW